MSRAQTFVRYWLPVFIWGFVIFSASTDGFSSQRTSRFLAPLIRTLFPFLSDDERKWIELAVRKLAHMVEYGILSGLLWRALYKPSSSSPPQPWSKDHALGAWTLAVLYAISDEFHQSWTASREGHPRDVGFDALGAFGGLVALWLWRRFVSRRCR